MVISPPSSAKTHSLVYVLCFFFSVSSYVFSVSSSSAQFCISSLVSSNPTISHKRYGTGDLFFFYGFVGGSSSSSTSTVWHGSSWMYPQTSHCYLLRTNEREGRENVHSDKNGRVCRRVVGVAEKKRQHLCLHVWSQGYGEGYR
ncbi:unnamed protein product [Brassica oleracea var. botrytis]